MNTYLVWAFFLIIAGLLIAEVIDDRKERRQQMKLNLYRRAELIGKRRLNHEPL